KEPLVDLVPGPRGADVNDVVVELHGLVGRDVRDLDVDRVEVLFLLLLLLCGSGEPDCGGEGERGDPGGTHRDLPGRMGAAGWDQQPQDNATRAEANGEVRPRYSLATLLRHTYHQHSFPISVGHCMAGTSLPLLQPRSFGETSRRDRWWVQPALIFVGLSL